MLQKDLSFKHVNSCMIKNLSEVTLKLGDTYLSRYK